MECDVAVLGGGPGGYTAAIRAAQLGAKTVCIEKESELGGTCLRVGCIPTKAWVQTAYALKEAEETFGKLGVSVGRAELDFATANEWKAKVVKQLTGGVAGLFKANGVDWVKGTGTFRDANTIAIEGEEDVTFRNAIIATGSYPLRPPIDGLESELCVDSTGLLEQTEVPKRLVVLGGGIIGCEFASIFQRFGSDVTVIEMLPTLIPQEDEDATKELAKQFERRGITLHLEKQCTKVEERDGTLTVHFGESETTEADLMLVSVGRSPVVEGIGLEEVGVEFDKRSGITADEHRRTTVSHIYAIGDCAGYWQFAHTAFREGEVAAENALGHDAIVDNRGVPRPTYTDPEIAGVGLTEAEARAREWAVRRLTALGFANVSLRRLGHAALLLIDRAAPGYFLPEGQGVGLARKIGCDLILRLRAGGRIAWESYGHGEPPIMFVISHAPPIRATSMSAAVTDTTSPGFASM